MDKTPFDQNAICRINVMKSVVKNCVNFFLLVQHVPASPSQTKMRLTKNKGTKNNNFVFESLQFQGRERERER